MNYQITKQGYLIKGITRAYKSGKRERYFVEIPLRFIEIQNVNKDTEFLIIPYEKVKP